ncbi:uncharacterized protein G2W53_034621 [Senna tora]|uniref:Uncharacterized protein n=1 Tax=Senna tora TaxID=362788 RepID=A0A834T2Z2_9FABA|nr:uncharacterized protein G2W53_034621 [Senna tora]
MSQSEVEPKERDFSTGLKDEGKAGKDLLDLFVTTGSSEIVRLHLLYRRLVDWEAAALNHSAP